MIKFVTFNLINPRVFDIMFEISLYNMKTEPTLDIIIGKRVFKLYKPRKKS